MSKIKRLLALVLSCSISYLSLAAVFPSALAADNYDSRACNYNTTFPSESKVLTSDDDEPFRVFDIYDAFYGLTTETTTTTTETTETTTTTTETTTTTTETTMSTTQTTTATETTTTTTTSIETTTTTEAPTTTTTSTTEAPTTTTTSTTEARTTTTTSAPTVVTTTQTSSVTSVPATTTELSASKPITSETVASTSKQVTTTTSVQSAHTTLSTSQTAQSITSTSSTESTTVTTMNGLPPSGYLRGIDVSEHQGTIDWYRVKNSGCVDYVIIRAGYGRDPSQVDKQFYANIKGVRDYGIDYGLYWYSYASSVEEILIEAELCYDTIKDYSFNYPLYLDIEEGNILNDLSTAEITAMIEAFCFYFEERGYYVGVYSYATLLQSQVYRDHLAQFDVWVAQHADQLTAYNGHYGMWQYSHTGSIDGIYGDVDLNYCYKYYPGIIDVNPVGGSLPVTTAPVTETTTIATADTTPHGIDISAENGDIDWETAVADDNFSYVMLKVGHGGETIELDPYFEKNYAELKQRGIPCGAYWEVRSTTPEAIREEADIFYSLIMNKQFEYPLYMDLTSNAITQAGLDRSHMWELIDVFCLTIQNRGCYIGIRGYGDFMTESIDPAIYKKYDVWLDTPDGYNPEFAYSYGVLHKEVKEIAGITGTVHVSVRRKNYPYIMQENHLNGY